MQLAGSDNRRLTPRIWDTDWLVLSELSEALTNEIRAQMKPGYKLVDFGCGSMPYRQVVEATGATYIGADLDDVGDIHINADGTLPLSDGSVNTVLSIQVLEHIRNLDSYCGEIHRILKKDGVLLLSTHGSWLYHPHPEDHRRWTRTGLKEDLRQRGFAVEETRAITGPLATTTLIRLTSFAFVIRKIPLIGGLLTGLCAIIMNLRAVIEEKITPVDIRRDNGCVYLVRARRVER